MVWLTLISIPLAIVLPFHPVENRADESQFVGVAWLIGLFVILAVSRNALTTRATQGRPLFPGSGALSLLIVAGWHEILPQRFQRFLPAIIVLLLFFCNIVLWLTGVVPIYYQPFLD